MFQQRSHKLGFFKGTILADKGNNKQSPGPISFPDPGGIDENSSSGTLITRVLCDDPYYSQNQLTTTLPAGILDNDEFYIDNSNLNEPKLKVGPSANLNHEADSTKTVRVRVANPDGLLTEVSYGFPVNDINEPPIGAILSNYTIDEDPVGSAPALYRTVGQLILFGDPDAGDYISSAIITSQDVPGTFVLDNPSGNDWYLKNDTALNHEDRSEHDITIQVTDSGGLTASSTLTITVNDVNDDVEDFSLSNNSVDVSSGSAPYLVGEIENIIDEDVSDTHTITLPTGVNDNDKFAEGDFLGNPAIYLSNTEPDGSYTITVRVTDSGSDYLEKNFTINVTGNSTTTQYTLTTDLIDPVNVYDDGNSPLVYDQISTLSRMERHVYSVQNPSDEVVGNNSYNYLSGGSIDWSNTQSPGVGRNTRGSGYTMECHAMFLQDSSGGSIYDRKGETIDSVDEVRVYLDPSAPIVDASGTTVSGYTLSLTSTNVNFRLFKPKGCYDNTGYIDTSSSSFGWANVADAFAKVGPDFDDVLPVGTGWSLSPNGVLLASKSAPENSTLITFSPSDIQADLKTLIDDWVNNYNYNGSVPENNSNCPVTGLVLSSAFTEYRRFTAVTKIEIDVTFST